jgi:hypothetical protein
VKEVLMHIYHFLAAHDFITILKEIHKLDWMLIASSVYTWLVVLPILTYLLWTRKFKRITALGSLFLFLLLIQKTLSPAGENLSLRNLLIFLSGAVALVGLNLYLLFVRE